jgi:nitrogen fixation/metabolism regulation signal transduction histidine kinase
MLQRMIGEDIEFSIGLEPKRGQIKADPAQITQIIMNLVVNARDAMPKRPLTFESQTILLDEDYAKFMTTYSRPYVMQVVQYNGSDGRFDIKQIFEPFFTTKEQGKGTGLAFPRCTVSSSKARSIQVESIPNREPSFAFTCPG